MDLLYRKHEGVTLLCQNNEEASIKIYSLNDVMQQATGFAEEDLKGHTLQEMLSERHAAQLDEYIDYVNDTSDLARVMGHMRDLKLKHKDGHEFTVENFKLVRIDAKDRHQWFRLIVEDSVQKREIEAFKKILAENFKGHEALDAESGLIDADSIKKDLELSQHYVGTEKLNACFAYVQLDGFEALSARYGRKTAVEALVHVAKGLKRNLRSDDTVGRVAEDAVGVLLMDIGVDSVRLVMNRLRALITAEEVTLGEMKRRNLAISIAFAPIDSAPGIAGMPDRCAELLEQDGAGFVQLPPAA